VTLALHCLSSASSFQVKIKEALYVNWKILTLNQRVMDLSLSS